MPGLEQSKLHYAVCTLNGPTVQAALDSGCELSARDGKGRTALHLAIMHSSHDKAAEVLDCSRCVDGLDIDAQDMYGATALHMASRRNCVAGVTLLLQHRASASIADNHGHNPLQVTMTRRECANSAPDSAKRTRVRWLLQEAGTNRVKSAAKK